MKCLNLGVYLETNLDSTKLRFNGNIHAHLVSIFMS